MKKRLLVIITFALFINSYAQDSKTFLIDATRLQEVKKKILQKDKLTLQLIDSLKKQADALLNMKPVSVMDKAFSPVSGNKHDYMSQAPYFWYDSTKANGLPYIRKDGVRNPEIYKITDRTYLGRLENASRILSLAWYLTGEEKFAEKAAKLLHTWFLDEATKMNPHLEYGQAIPGINTGRGIGIIETIALIGIADAAGLLNGSKSWTTIDHQALQQWYSQYLNWLLTSKNGTDEHNAKNNHGTWYYAQVIDFALFTGDKQKARQLAEESKKRLDSQLTKEGKQPLELERTNGLGYSTMNLRGWFAVATLAEKTGVDLWNYKTTETVGLRTAFDWLMPYAIGEKKWEYQQISKYNKTDIYPLLLQAANKFKDDHYLNYSNEINKEDNDLLTALLYRN
ncbi:MAG TPA: alginate lyase family protein [Chitinophagaceae bacterium]|nr:alginate lyase family protein [Chitinophagaceae bacterium]